MQDSLVIPVVNESLDWFFKRVLNEHYESRRHVLSQTNEEFITAIDYIMTNHIDDKASYPPESAEQWVNYYKKLKSPFKNILLVYLKLDINSFLSHKDRSRVHHKTEIVALENTLKELLIIPKSLDFSNSVLHLATGLWALDNDDTNLTISSLSNPSINLSSYFDPPKNMIKIIVDSLIISHKPQIALFLSKIYRREDWDENYDEIYPFLLISSGQLIEAVRYERLFSNRPNYNEILHRFFEMCSKWNVTKSLNRLNLSIEEEEVLNLHITMESRSVTPSGTQTIRHKSSSKPKPRNRSIQVVQRTPSFNDSPARNTRSRKKVVN